MSVVVSVTDLTTQAAWMAGLAILALVLAGWRKNARATPRIPRGEPILRRSWEPGPIAETTTSLYKSPGLLRGLGGAVAGSAVFVPVAATGTAGRWPWPVGGVGFVGWLTEADADRA